jgi:predicted mannosyl-3-phosphoglycerate phosphatase (HAD superfamily)
LGELGKHVGAVEEASSQKVGQLAKFISEDLITRQLEVLANQCKKVLKNVQTEESKESTGLTKQTAAVGNDIRQSPLPSPCFDIV